MVGDSPIDESSRKQRTPQKKLTAEAKVRLREVLARDDCRKADGSPDYAMVAQLTGLTYGQVYAFVNKDRYQRATQSEANTEKLVPTEAEIIDGGSPKPPPGVMVTPSQWAEIQSLYRQQKRLAAKDWEELGMTPEMAQRVENMGRIGKAPMIHVIGTIYGGLIKHVGMLDQIIETDAKKIMDDALPSEKDQEGMEVEDGKKQREWRYALYAGMKLNLEIYNSVHKTQAILSRVMKDMKDMGVKKPDEKGVFEMPAVSERGNDG